MRSIRTILTLVLLAALAASAFADDMTSIVADKIKDLEKQRVEVVKNVKKAQELFDLSRRQIDAIDGALITLKNLGELSPAEKKVIQEAEAKDKIHSAVTEKGS